MRDEFAYLLSQVCHDVKIEPGIQPADDATVMGYWSEIELVNSW